MTRIWKAFYLTVGLFIGAAIGIPLVVAQSPAPSDTSTGLTRIPGGNSSTPGISDLASRNSGVSIGNGLLVVFGHLSPIQQVGNTGPVITGCGTGASGTGSDAAGTVTMGTGTPTGCTITFGAAYTVAPNCTVTWQANLAAMGYTITNTALVTTQTATNSNKINYVCMANFAG